MIYHTRHGLWAAIDATYYGGGRSTIDGVPGESLQDIRVGAHLAIPIDRHNSIKIAASTGAYARVGGNFTTAVIASAVPLGRRQAAGVLALDGAGGHALHEPLR